MKIQVNSGKNVATDARTTRLIEDKVKQALKNFAGRLTRVEVHLSDVNSHKFGVQDKRCLIEVRPARHRPLTVRSAGRTPAGAVRDALTKLRSSLHTFYGRLEAKRPTRAAIAKATRRPAAAARKTARTAKRKTTAVRRTKATISGTRSKVASRSTKSATHRNKTATRRAGVSVRAKAAPRKKTAVASRGAVAVASSDGRGPKKMPIYQGRRQSWPPR
jgi:hypothetical protein